MPAPLDVAFHNHYNDVYDNKAVNVPTYSNQVKNSRQYKQNMINMMNNSNTSTKSTPRYPWPVESKNHYVNQPNIHRSPTPFYINRREYFGKGNFILNNLKTIQECLCYVITFAICMIILLLIMLVAF
tara:strand:+ start:324 stop:707 length:384 start_codon:yes stop_codon:yes gene_type:complete